jgi:hypothetical protein
MCCLTPREGGFCKWCLIRSFWTERTCRLVPFTQSTKSSKVRIMMLLGPAHSQEGTRPASAVLVTPCLILGPVHECAPFVTIQQTVCLGNVPHLMCVPKCMCMWAYVHACVYRCVYTLSVCYLHMCVCVYIHMNCCVVYECKYVSLGMSPCMCIYVCVYMSVPVCFMCVCMYSVRTCIGTCMCVLCMYRCACICVYVMCVPCVLANCLLPEQAPEIISK